jgi:hypothetical protein
MQKTTVYLEEDSLRALKRLARERGKAEAELIREAVRLYTRKAGRPKAKSLGIAKGPSDLAARTEELLAEGFGADGSDR